MIKRFSDWLLRSLCRGDLHIYIHGDLQEYHLKQRSVYGKPLAELLYLKEVILLLRPGLMQLPLTTPSTNHIDMIRSYIKIALRTLRRQWVYTSVNILGLATGIISLFFILIFIESELSYDHHHVDKDRTYRITTQSVVNGETVKMATSPPGLSRRLMADLPEIETSTRVVSFLGIKKNILKVGERTFPEKKGYLADSNFFDVHSYPILAGNKRTMLSKPQSMVLSRTLAMKMFLSTDILGEVVTIINDYGKSDYQITGVYGTEGINSHLDATFFCSMNSGSIGAFVTGNDRIVGNNFLYTYVKTKKGVDIQELSQKMPSFLSRYMEKVEHSHGFIPISRIYLHGNMQNESGIGGDIRYIYILVTIALLILIVACVNFANMVTAQADRRTKEIGIRKTFGAQRQMIISQFLGEAAVLTFFAAWFSLVVIWLLSPYYTNLTGKEVSLSLLIEKMPWLLLIAGVTSLLAGSYPSFYLSTLKLQSVMHTQAKDSRSLLIRRALVTFQFAVGILFMLGSLTILNQLHFIQNKPLGFHTSNQLIVPLQSEEAIDQLETLKRAFSSIPGIESVAGTSYTPAEFVLSDNRYHRTRIPEGEGVIIRQNDVDFGLIETLGIELLAGRTFQSNRSSHDSSVVLNQSAVEALGLTVEEAINRSIYTSEGEGVIAYKVIGVVDDFHANSLHRPIEPYLFAMRPGRGVSSLIVTISNSDLQRIISAMDQGWRELFPSLPFEFDFLDRQLNRRYSNDIKFGQVLLLFSAVALTLCLIGIFALTSFSVQQNIKSISIRKVLGASTARIYLGMAYKFILLILIASAIALPLGIILMERWLGLFAYRIEPGIASAVGPVLMVVFCTLVVISYKLIKVARLNPASTLRSD